jgi:hypothetical protein
MSTTEPVSCPPARWYAVTRQRHDNKPWGEIHAGEVGSSAAACGARAERWVYWFDRELEGLQALPSSTCLACRHLLVTQARGAGR